MNRIKMLLMTPLMAIVVALGLAAPASANVWSPVQSVENCSWNACLYVTYEMAVDGSGMLLGDVEIFQNGGLGVVGHSLRCWNQDGVVKFNKVSPGTNLDLGGSDGSYHIWHAAQEWSTATIITCRYNFDAILYSGDVNDQFARIAVANQY
jgi:hypothetical protein